VSLDAHEERLSEPEAMDELGEEIGLGYRNDTAEAIPPGTG
jgi:hypothetical protein